MSVSMKMTLKCSAEWEGKFREAGALMTEILGQKNGNWLCPKGPNAFAGNLDQRRNRRSVTYDDHLLAQLW